jgi:hypothetical protein
MAAAIKANPGASPQVLAGIVAKALPYMTAQSQMDYKQTMMALSARRADETEAHHVVQEDLGTKRVDNQTNNVNSLVDTRKANVGLKDKQVGINERREQRLGEGLEYRKTRDEMERARKSDEFAKRREDATKRNDLSAERAVIEAQAKKMQQIIQANSINSMLSPEEKAALTKEAEDFRTQEILRLRGRQSGPPQSAKPAAGASASAPAATQQGAAIPPDALAALQKAPSGSRLNIGGKYWVLGNDGQPQQVQ